MFATMSLITLPTVIACPFAAALIIKNERTRTAGSRTHKHMIAVDNVNTKLWVEHAVLMPCTYMLYDHHTRRSPHQRCTTRSVAIQTDIACTGGGSYQGRAFRQPRDHTVLFRGAGRCSHQHN